MVGLWIFLIRGEEPPWEGGGSRLSDWTTLEKVIEYNDVQIMIKYHPGKIHPSCLNISNSKIFYFVGPEVTIQRCISCCIEAQCSPLGLSMVFICKKNGSNWSEGLEN